MSVDLVVICLVIGLVCLIAAAARVPLAAVHLGWAGMAFLALAELISGRINVG